MGWVQANLPLGACLQASFVGLGLVAVYSFPALGKWPHCRLAIGFFVNVFVVLFLASPQTPLLTSPGFLKALCWRWGAGLFLAPHSPFIAFNAICCYGFFRLPAKNVAVINGLCSRHPLKGSLDMGRLEAPATGTKRP